MSSTTPSYALEISLSIMALQWPEFVIIIARVNIEDPFHKTCLVPFCSHNPIIHTHTYRHTHHSIQDITNVDVPSVGTTDVGGHHIASVTL